MLPSDESGTFFIQSRPGEVVSRRSGDNVFRISTWYQDGKRPALLDFSFTYNNKRRACLFNILKKQPTRVAGAKILLKFTNILTYKYMYMNSQQQTSFSTYSGQAGPGVAGTIFSLSILHHGMKDVSTCLLFLYI